MAAKKQKNNSINLLKGITGSRLAKIIAVIAIVLTIPVTVLMSQKQQNTQQEAAGCPGTCINIFSQNCNGTLKRGVCPGDAKWICCIPKKTTTASKSCWDYGGVCIDTNKQSKCNNGTSPVAGLCPGGTNNIKCCKPTVQEKCVEKYPKGACQNDNQPCSGKYLKGLCNGPSYRLCCTKK
ncbi:hypothetical protein M1349_03185 [Patescibacteria group bacterium]|nr:hypothetical protein [Patescibacteria group bacterium]